jgi:hypothetical protein
MGVTLKDIWLCQLILIVELGFIGGLLVTKL